MLSGDRNIHGHFTEAETRNYARVYSRPESTRADDEILR